MRLGKRLVRLAMLATLLGGTAAVLSPAALAVGRPAAAADQGFVRCANLSLGTLEDIYLSLTDAAAGGVDGQPEPAAEPKPSTT